MEFYDTGMHSQIINFAKIAISGESDLNSYKALLVYGTKGIGKTVSAMDFCAKRKSTLYFSFRHIDAALAPLMFSLDCDAIDTCDKWADFFAHLEMTARRRTTIVIFDDVDRRNDKDEFISELDKFLQSKKHNCVVVLLCRKDIQLPFKVMKYEMPLFTPWDLNRIFPGRNRIELMRIYTVTAGIPALVAAYDGEQSFEANLKAFFAPDSAFYRWTAEYMSEEFRSPESYNTLFFGMSMGETRIVQLSEMSGFPNNKCDKYIKALDAAGLIEKSVEPDESGTMRTNYRPKNAYLELWYRYIFPNQTVLFNEPAETLIKDIVEKVDYYYLPQEFRRACVRWLENKGQFRYYEMLHFDDVDRQNITIDTYRFDFMLRGKDKRYFIKIWDRIDQTFDKKAFVEFEEAALTISPHYNNEYLIFSINRFSDYCWQQVRPYENVKLIQSEMLKY